MLPKLLTLATLLLAVAAKSTFKDREARFFGYRYTKTEIVPKMVTSLLPSSCVQVEASLPPCRSVRHLDEFPRFLGGKIYAEHSENILNKTRPKDPQPAILTTPLGWGEYLGIYAPTVTVQAIHLQTTTVLDPRTVVTFSVRGCKPSRLPMDLGLCPPAPKPVNINPTKSSVLVVTQTALPETIIQLNDMVEPGEEVVGVDDETTKETQGLD